MAGSDEQRDSPVASRPGDPGPLSRLLQELADAPGEDALDAWREELKPGNRLDRFEIRRELGRGGFGAVYEAYDDELGRIVAIKTLRPGRARHELAAGWIKKEAEAIARLSHPGIVTLHDVCNCASGPYLVMELLEGRTLARRLADGPLPRDEALRVAEEMAQGLAHAHKRGVIHRDLKPANVFLCDDGRVKLLDFGLAHLLGAKSESGGGTPAYMAPEQARGEGVDQRADVYAAGKVLDEMLGGKRPRHMEKAIASATLAEADARPRDGQAWLDLLRSGRRAGEGPVRLRRVALLAGTGLLAAAAAAGLLVHRSARPPGAAGATPAPSIAILPFADMSERRDQEYFADGVAEEILNALAHVEGLRVPGRTSSFWFKGKDVEPAEIGRRLDVAHLLEGSVRRSGNRLRVTAHIVKVGDGARLWSKTFDRELGDIFAVQDEVAKAVVEALKVKLLAGAGAQTRGRPPRIEVYEQYLIGRRLLDERSPASIQGAREAFERVVALDTGFAPAHAGLSHAFRDSAGFLASTPEEVTRFTTLGLASAERAIALDPGLADGYAARAGHRLSYSWDWDGSLGDLEHAIALGSRDPSTMRQYAYTLAALGRMPEAQAAARRGIDLDPLSSGVWLDMSMLLNAGGDFPGAEAAARRCLQASLNNPLCGRYLGMSLVGQGRPEEALVVFDGVQVPLYRLEGLSIAYHRMGQAQKSRAALDELVTLYPLRAAYQIAVAQAFRGEPDAAFEWLERSRVQHDGGLKYVGFDEAFQGLYADARWKPFLKRLNLPVDRTGTAR